MSGRAITTPQHTVSIIIDGKQVVGPEAYEISTDMVSHDNRFSMRFPFKRDVWDLCKVDRPIRVLIDDTCVLKGFIDEEYVPDDGNDVVEINGRDMYGRMLQESCPGINFANLSMKDLIALAADPWFKIVVFDNAFNRKVSRGRGQKAKSYKEPVVLFSEKKIGTHIEPGQRRAQVVQDLCEQAGCLAWPTSDGVALMVGLPNYHQEAQYSLFMPASGSDQVSRATCAGMGTHFSSGDRYSRIVVVGSGTGTDANYGPGTVSRYGEAKNNDATPDGDGLDFSAPKRLIVRRSVKSPDEAEELAEREMAKRDSLGHWVSARAYGHGQLIAGAYRTLFATDTIAAVEDERTGLVGKYLITQCVFRSGRSSGEETSLHLVPTGSVLA